MAPSSCTMACTPTSRHRGSVQRRHQPRRDPAGGEKAGGGKSRFQRAAPTVLKDLGEHPDGGGKIQVLSGRYGPYVKHGEVNATMPNGKDPAAISVAEAVELIAARAAKGPSKKKPVRKASRPTPSRRQKVQNRRRRTGSRPKAKAANQPSRAKPKCLAHDPRGRADMSRRRRRAQRRAAHPSATGCPAGTRSSSSSRRRRRRSASARSRGPSTCAGRSASSSIACWPACPKTACCRATARACARRAACRR